MQRYIFFTFLLGLAACNSITPEITHEELHEHVASLASDEFSGRYPGTRGDSLSIAYLVNDLQKSGFNENNIHLQNIEVITGMNLGPGNALSAAGKQLNLNKDFMPFPFSDNAEISAEVCFAGYGFSIRNNQITWDDYENLSTKDKWVLILRGEPDIDSTESLFRNQSQDYYKAMTAQEKGAAGVILVSGPFFDEKDMLIELEGNVSRIDIPVIQLKRERADELIAGTGLTMRSLENTLNKNRKPASFQTDISLTALVNIETNRVVTHNIIALLEPVREDVNSYIAIGAHYDHLGTGGKQSSSRRKDTVAVHNGADDNASGVAGVLEIGENILHSDKREKGYLFLFFGAEEMGLLGSKHFVENPVVDIQNIDAMINMDMIGRIKDSIHLQINGTGTSLEADSLLDEINKNYGFQLSKSEEGYGPSDHAAFYGKDIPVFFITTGAHPDYHTPEDDAETLDYDGMKRIADFATDLAFNLGKQDMHLTFQEAGPKTPANRGRRFKVTLGIMPDFTSSANNGLGVDFVSPGKPASQSGMEKGDVIIAIDDKPVKNIREYMFRMSKYNVGDRITVTVNRNSEEKILIVEL